MKRLILLTLLFSVRLISGLLQSYTFVRGGYTTVVLYDAAHLADPQLKFMITYMADTTIYIAGVIDAAVNRVICTETITTPIITAPRGCDSKDESTAVLRTNCGHKTVEGLQGYWGYDPYDYRCLEGGSEVTCLGPVYTVAGDTQFDTLTHAEDWNVLRAGVYVKSGIGPGCSIPAITHVEIVGPSITVTSTCGIGLRSGVYRQELGEEGYVFGMQTSRLVLTDPSLPLFGVVSLFLGNVMFTEAGGVGFGVAFAPGNYTTACLFTLSLTQMPVPLQLVEPPIRSAADYYAVQQSDAFSALKVCNIAVGRLAFDTKRTIYAGLPEGVVGGGIPVLKTRDGVPIEFAADPRFADFDMDCSRFYPPAETFRGFGFNGFDGPVYSRYVPASLTCYAPFPYPELITRVTDNNPDIAEGTIIPRAKQCHMLGGWLATATGDVCAVDVWKTYCRRGWIYFDQRCWYKFDPDQDSQYRVTTGADSTRVCALMNEHATPMLSATYTISAWLQRFFVFWRYPTTVTRIVVSGRQCRCYSATDGAVACPCTTPEFPLCSYHVKDDPIYWHDMDVHPATLLVLRDGQTGVPHDGNEIMCSCIAGSAGKYCGTRTCVAPIDVVSSTLVTNSSLLAFFGRCYAHGHGTCNNDNPNRCRCLPGYGPAGDLMLDQNVQYPCFFPAWFGSYTQPQVRIEGDVYALQLVGEGALVCGGVGRGAGVISGWNKGTCRCTTRIGFYVPALREPAWDGWACSCPVTFPVPGFSVTQKTCNGHGRCCPTDNPQECHGRTNGCGCDDGYAGMACTGRVPHSLAVAATATSVSGGYITVTLKTRADIKKVYVDVRDAVPGPWKVMSTDTVTPCVRVNRTEPWEWVYGERWDCPSVGVESGVMVYMRNVTAATVIRVYNENYLPGGYHPNPFSARFFATSRYQQYGLFTEIQNFTHAQYGVTSGPTFCMPGFTGPTCSAGISAFRYYEGGTGGFTPRLCGDSTEPKRGTVGSENCTCAWLGDGIEFYGDSCECAYVNGVACGGIGRCTPTGFQYGSCKSGIDLLREDALAVPYSENPPRGREFDGNLIVTVDGQDWTYWYGTMYLDYPSEIEFCDPFVSFTVPVMSVVTPGRLPIRVNVVLHVVELNGTVTAQTLSTLPGDARHCANPTDRGCVVSFEWALAPDSNATLDNVRGGRVRCATSSIPTPALPALASPYGVTHCSNPYHRMFDGGLTGHTECGTEPITVYDSGVLGLAFGLFWNLTEGIDFSLPLAEWTDAQYSMIASVINWDRCGAYMVNAETWDQYVAELTALAITIPEERVHNFPNGSYVHMANVHLSVDAIGVFALNRAGAVCGWRPSPFTQGSSVDVDTHACNSSFSRIFALTANYTRVTQTLKKVVYFNTLLPGWDGHEINAFVDSVNRTHKWPSLATFACAEGDLRSKPISISSADDRAFLYRTWASTFAPQRCSHDSQCMDGSSCIRSPYDVHVPWLNGDPLAELTATFGHEGGCDCGAVVTSGFFDGETYCSSCKLGYGPDTDQDYMGLISFAGRVGAEWYNGTKTPLPPRCSLPFDPMSTRITGVCGGKGWIRYGSNVTTSGWALQVFPHGVVRTCSVVVLDGAVRFGLLHHDTAGGAEIQSFMDGAGGLLTFIHSAFYGEGGVPIADGRLACQNDRISGRERETMRGAGGEVVRTREFRHWAMGFLF